MTLRPQRAGLRRLTAGLLIVLGAATGVIAGRQTQPVLGGTYSSLEPRRRALVDDWTRRVVKVTGQALQPAAVYDTAISLSAKTTFDAVTNALMTTPLTDDAGVRFGDALDIVQSIDAVHGAIVGAPGDHQFRMYVGLKPAAIDMLERSREFKRAADNTVYHKGYPINFRQQGGPPSMQVSIALDKRNADIDVDYRGSSFPVGLFNGHLTSSNSDVRAGGNYDRHANRWAGFQNWWRSIFGIRVKGAPGDAVKDEDRLLGGSPRIGRKPIVPSMEDFLKAWLIDGDQKATMGYFSERSYFCVTEDDDEPAAADRGMVPFILMRNLRVAHEAVGPRTTLEGTTVGVRLTKPGLRVVTQPHHAQFVIYEVPDDLAVKFDCESRMSLGKQKSASRVYGNYYGATFYLETPAGKGYTLALLWARVNGYMKIVSWQAEPDSEDTDLPASATAPVAAGPVARADATLVQAAKGFLDSWLIRKDYDAAFSYLSPKAYACYDLNRGPDQAAAFSPQDAARRLRNALEAAGAKMPKSRLEDLIEAVQPVHPSVRLLDHPNARAFALTQVPNAIADMADCATRAKGAKITGEVPLEYGNAFGMNLRFRTGGEAPVLRLLWIKDAGVWHIAAYDVEYP